MDIDTLLNELDPCGKQKIFYHFTTLDCFTSILENQELRLTSYQHLNDTKEITHGIELIFPLIKKHYKNNKNQILTILLTLVRCFYDFKSEEERVEFLNTKFLKNEFQEELESHRKKPLEKVYQVYPLSFTETEENLSLWRLYADDGRGVAIGFDVALLFKAQYKLNPQTAKTKMIYCDSEKECFIQRLLKIADNNSKLMKGLLTILPALKHSSFSQEKEIRLFQVENGKEGHDYSKQKGASHYKHNLPNDSSKINGEQMVDIDDKEYKKEHIKIQFEKKIIKEIWIGPRCNFDRSEKALKKLLTDNGYEKDSIEIKQYESSYKGLTTNVTKSF